MRGRRDQHHFSNGNHHSQSFSNSHRRARSLSRDRDRHRSIRPGRTLVKDSPSLEPDRGTANCPSARAKWQDRLNFRFVRLATPGSARTFDTRLHVDIWCEREAKLFEATGVEGTDYSRFITSKIEINCGPVPYQTYKVDLKPRTYVGQKVSPHLYAPDEVKAVDRSVDDL